MTTASTVCYKKMRMTTGEKEQEIKNKVCMYPLKGGRTLIPKYTLSHYILTEQWVPAQKQNANIKKCSDNCLKKQIQKNWQADVKRSAPRETLVTNSFTSLVAMLIITSLSHCHDNPYLSARLSWQSLPLCQVVATTLTSLLCDGFFANIQPDKLLHLWLPLQSWHFCLVVTTILTSLSVCHNNPDLSAQLSQQSWPLCLFVTTILTSLFVCHNNPDLSVCLSQQSWPLCLFVTTILTYLPSCHNNPDLSVCHNNPDLSAQLSQQSWPLCLFVTTILTSLSVCHNNPDLSVCLSQQSWPICPVVTTILTYLFVTTILTYLPSCHNNPDLSACLSQQSWPLCLFVTTILTSLPGCRNNPYLSAMWWFLCQCPAWRTASPLLQSTPQAPSWWCPASGNTGTDSRQWITVNLPILQQQGNFFRSGISKGDKNWAQNTLKLPHLHTVQKIYIYINHLFFVFGKRVREGLKAWLVQSLLDSAGASRGRGRGRGRVEDMGGGDCIGWYLVF